MKVRLNFSISEALYGRLVRYCDDVGRTPTDVSRQLILEYLDNDLPFPDVESDHGPERRTSLLLPQEVLQGFEDKAALFRVTKSRLVSGLIRFFLSRRECVKSDVSDETEDRCRELLTRLVRGLLWPSASSSIPDHMEALAEAVEFLGLEEELRSECRS